jgi:MFS family permease
VGRKEKMIKNDKKTGGFHYAYLIAAACCAISAASVGLTISCAGIFFDPVSKELGVGKGDFAVYMSVLLFASTLTLTIAGKIYAKYNARAIILINVIIVSLAFAAMSALNSVYQFYAAGAFLGIAMAFLFFLLVPTMINRWFKARVGFFIGLCSAFTGVGGILFNPLGAWVITNYGWRSGYLSFAFINLALALPFALAIKNLPGDKGLRPYGDNGDVQPDGNPDSVTGVAYSTAIKSGAFYITLLFGFSIAFLTTVNFYLPSYAGSLGMSLTLGATIASASMVGNTAGKVLLGAINDRSVAAGLTFTMACGFVGVGTMVFLAKTGVWAVLLGAVLYGISYAGMAVQTPLTVRQIFGSRNYSQIYSTIAMVAAFSTAIGSAAWGFIVDSTGSYAVTFSMAMGVAVLTFVFGYLSLRSGKKTQTHLGKR